ncbi:hypothetical protein A2U01_0008511 [Trifolium medium]|uniref:Uncharacterized protein n=1 Tax=Trifolium medium TaxID=97028 RepID=A0A392MMX4_9FABA|nr:hypothetical protein [Trifolium medium]
MADGTRFCTIETQLQQLTDTIHNQIQGQLAHLTETVSNPSPPPLPSRNVKLEFPRFKGSHALE